MPIDAIVTLLAGPFGEEGADTVVMIFARVALVAFPFGEVPAQEGWFCHNLPAW